MAAPPTRPRLRARYDGRQQRVVDVAARLFAERGFHAVSIGDLVAETGLASGGLYHYIGSKDRLLFLVLERLMEPLLVDARAAVAAEESAEAQLRALVRVWVEHVERRRDHVRVFVQERVAAQHGPYWEAIVARRDAFERLLAAVVDRLHAEGRLALDDPALALRALLGMVNWTPMWLAPGGRLTAAEIADGYVSLLGTVPVRGQSPVSPTLRP